MAREYKTRFGRWLVTRRVRRDAFATHGVLAATLYGYLAETPRTLDQLRARFRGAPHFRVALARLRAVGLVAIVEDGDIHLYALNREAGPP